MSWLLDRLGIEATKFLFVLVSAFLCGLFVAVMFSFFSGRFLPLPFFAIWFSAWGVFFSLAGMFSNKH